MTKYEVDTKQLSSNGLFIIVPGYNWMAISSIILDNLMNTKHCSPCQLCLRSKIKVEVKSEKMGYTVKTSGKNIYENQLFYAFSDMLPLNRTN